MTTKQSAIQCVQRAADFIANQLKDDIVPSLDGIAQASGLSKFHFHRIYRLITGETCAQTITRLRLARGADALRDHSSSITEAAMAAGYGSSQAFAKAVKRELANTASDLKSDPERLADTIEILSEPLTPANHENGPLVRIEVCSLDPFEIMVIRTVDTYPNLNDTYWKLVEAAGDPETVRAVFGIPHRDIASHSDGGFVFECALTLATPISDLPSGISKRTINAGMYLIVRHTGSDDILPSTLDVLYDFVLRSNDIVLSDEPSIFHFVDDPEEVDEESCRTDIYVKVEINEQEGSPCAQG